MKVAAGYVMSLILAFGLFCFAQNTPDAFKKKVNLDDVKIKGEINKGQSLLNRKTKINLDERIKIPNNFRRAILENLDSELEGISNIDKK